MKVQITQPMIKYLCIATVLIVGAGCANSNSQHPASFPAISAAHTYIVALPGMDGRSSFDINCLRGLEDAGVTRHIELYDYTTPYKLMFAIWAQKHNRIAAQHVADQIAAKMKEDPSAKIVLVGWSLGCAVTLWTLEDLPENVQVQSVLIFEPCVTPGHDLRCALKHVRGHCFVVESCGDVYALGIGTLLVGTGDGFHTPGAGLCGFHRPADCAAEEYHKLVELPYTLDWFKYGDLAGHITPLSRSLARYELGPMLIDDASAQ